MGYCGAGSRSPVLMNHFNHCIMVCALGLLVIYYFKLFNLSTSHSSILGCFVPSIFIGALIISSRSDTPILVLSLMHVPCHDPPWTIGGRVASTTQWGDRRPWIQDLFL